MNLHRLPKIKTNLWPIPPGSKQHWNCKWSLL